MLEEAGEVLENMLKASCLPLGFIVFLPAVLLLVAQPLPAADAAHEFTVYRMQQYDLQGQPYETQMPPPHMETSFIQPVHKDHGLRGCPVPTFVAPTKCNLYLSRRKLRGTVLIAASCLLRAVFTPLPTLAPALKGGYETHDLRGVLGVLTCTLSASDMLGAAGTSLPGERGPQSYSVEALGPMRPSVLSMSFLPSTIRTLPWSRPLCLPASPDGTFLESRNGFVLLAPSPRLSTGPGTRNAVLNTEARTVDADVLSRRCVLMRLVDFSYEQYQKALRQSAGAVVIILPRAMAAVPQDVVRQFMEIEPEMLAMETIVPVYFAMEDEALLSIYEQTQAASASQGSASAAEEQMVTSGVQSKAVSDWLITSVEGRLTGLGGEDLPTIVIVAHYDAFGVAPWLSLGADSNGSGVSVLLELARLFSRLYTYKRTHAAYNLLFFASGGGKFNYQGTKRWLEDNLDHTDSSLLQDNVAFVLCLDTVGRGSSLHLHVSKPPREGTLQHAFLRELETVAAHQFPEVRFSMVHKKINLAEDALAWEHERFAIRRLPAFTLSHLESHRDSQRSSIMDVRSRVDSKTLTRNTRIIAEALTRVIYNLTEKGTPPDMPVFTEQMQIQQEQLDSVMDWLTYQPRAAQLLDKDGTFLSTLGHYLSRYLKDVKQHHVKADKRDPEFVFYDQLKQVMNAYRVKPAIFDLLLAVCIGAYLGMAYTAVQHFDLLYKTVQRLLVKAKTQ
ncbi:PREDICTED: nicalin [Galeopterus variegatus]|uniref:BOS complex subunit NCLN n=1 Tax=Galeopterus variegatus TaxID=482537 RepID=A0ABM0SEV7_GALVR|nr:PREDICTED: nicalin [Galeopterus variegatus]